MKMPTFKLFAATLAMMPLPALAAERPAETGRVSYADLDLTTGAGRSALERRIRTQASDACRRELRGAAWTPLELHLCLEWATEEARGSADRLIAQAGRTTRPERIAAAR